MGQTSAWGLSALGQLPVGGMSMARLMGRVTTLPCEGHPPGYVSHCAVRKTFLEMELVSLKFKSANERVA